MQVKRLAVVVVAACLLGCSSNGQGQTQKQAQSQTANAKPSAPAKRDVQPSAPVERDPRPVVHSPSPSEPEPVVDDETAARFEEVARKLREAGELEHAAYVEERLQAHTNQP